MMSKLYDLLLTLTCMVGVIICLRPELFVYVRNYLFTSGIICLWLSNQRPKDDIQQFRKRTIIKMQDALANNLTIAQDCFVKGKSTDPT